MVENGYELVAFDMDGVLVDCESTWVWIHSHFGVTNETALQQFTEGRIDDLEFMRRDIALWRAASNELRISDIERILRQVPMMSGVRETTAALREGGIRSVIVSGGLDIVAERIAREFGFDDWMANGLECDEEGRLTGEGILRVRLANKMEALQALFERYGVNRGRAVAIGNSFVDVPMFRGCGLSIAYNPVDELVVRNADHVVRSYDLQDVLPFIL